MGARVRIRWVIWLYILFWSIAPPKASPSIFEEESPAADFLSRYSICIETHFIDPGFSLLHFRLSNDPVSNPQKMLENNYLRPYLMNSEVAFWKNVGEEIENERHFALEASVLTVRVEKKTCPESYEEIQKYDDFERTEDLYVYLGRLFKYEISKCARQFKENKRKELVELFYI